MPKVSTLVLVIILVIFVMWMVNKSPKEGLTIPANAAPVKISEVKRLMRGGVPKSTDQYLTNVDVGAMQHLGTFNPDSTSEGFVAESGSANVEVTSTDLQRQLFTGIGANESYLIRPKNDAYIVKNGYVVKNKYASQNARGPSRPMM